VNPRLLATVLLGGVAALDATPVAQTLLSQPLVTASIVGALWNEWRLALQVGIVLQVFAAGTSPLGARTPEDYASGGVIGAAAAVLLARGAPFAPAQDACALVGAMVGILAAILGVPLIKWQRRRHEGLSRWVEGELRLGHEGALGQAQGSAVVLAFGVGVAFCAAFLAISLWLLPSVVLHRSLRLARAWSVIQPLWMGFGLAHLLAAFVQRRFMRAALFGLGLVIGWILLLLRG
jgi:mannose/fructose/N-acetylgalactosamine-specific phosphotransferase system component IIC